MRGPAGVSGGSDPARHSERYHLRATRRARRRLRAILAGIPGHAIEDVKISDVIVVNRGGGTKERCASGRCRRKRSSIRSRICLATTPAHGFFIRHVRGLEMQAVKIEHANEDAARVCAGGCGGRGVWKNQGAGECGSADVCVEAGEGVQCVSEQAGAGYGNCGEAEKKEI